MASNELKPLFGIKQSQQCQLDRFAGGIPLELAKTIQALAFEIKKMCLLWLLNHSGVGTGGAGGATAPPII